MAYHHVEDGDGACLICCKAFGDEKPLLVEDGNEVNELFCKFKGSFQCFLKLLTGVGGDGGDLEEEEHVVDTILKKTLRRRPEEEEFRGDGEDNGAIWKSPFCSDCCEALTEICRLNQAMEEIRRNLMDHVRKLESSMMSPSIGKDHGGCGDADADASWAQIREQLISCVLRRSAKPSNSSSTRRSSGRPKRCRNLDHNSEQDKGGLKKATMNIAVKPCSVLLERLPPSCLKVKVLHGGNEPTGKSPDDSHRCRLGSRKSKLKALDFLTDNLEPPEDLMANDLDNDDDYTYEEASSEPDPPPITLQQPLSVSATPKPPRGRLFSLITPDLLMCKLSLIKVSHGGTQLTCLENGCSTILQDPDWFALFHKMRSHVDTIHIPHKGQRKVTQTCPVCNAKCVGGPKNFRTHLVSHHQLDSVICESCWKPIRNLADNYRRHKWSHKNEQEQAEAEEEIPKKELAKMERRLKSFELKREGTEVFAPPPKKRRKAAAMKPAKSQPLPKKKQVVRLSVPSRSAPHHFGTGSLPNKMFWIIDDNTLLFRYTLINVSDGWTTMKCLEKDCQFLVQNPTGDSLDLFQNMKEHVERNHFLKTWDNPKEAVEQPKRCPVPNCGVEYQEGSTFRSHLAGEHSILDKVICEICWKPMRNIADNYRSHKWFHKSRQEQLESMERPPSKFMRSAKIRKSDQNTKWPGKSDLEKINEGAQVDASAAFKNEYFSRLADNILLYKFTVLHITPGEGITCEEPECSTKIATSDPNCYAALEQFKDHVKQRHLSNPQAVSEYAAKARNCPLCTKYNPFVSGPSLQKHLFLGEHAPCPYICQSCWKPIRQKVEMDRHVKTHRNPEEKAEAYLQQAPTEPKRNRQRLGTFVCATCGKHFTKLIYLQTHEEIHLPKSQRRAWTCPHCPARLMSRPARDNHVERLHRPDLIKFRHCPICNKRYNKRDGYKYSVHVRSHTDDRPFVCDKCGKAFTSGTLLRLHRNVHSEERLFQCEFCEMSYKHHSNLKRHRATAHRDKVPEMGAEQKMRCTNYEYRDDFIGPRIAYPCQFCEKVFRLRSRMTKHVRAAHPNQVPV